MTSKLNLYSGTLAPHFFQTSVNKCAQSEMPFCLLLFLAWGQKVALWQVEEAFMVSFAAGAVVLIMRMYYGTVDNECNVHALVGGIIHQVGQVAKAKDCNSIQPSSFQSSAQRTLSQDEGNTILRKHFPAIKKKPYVKRNGGNGKVHSAANQPSEKRRGPVGVWRVQGAAGEIRRDVRLFFQRRFLLQLFRNGPDQHFHAERASAAGGGQLHWKRW